MTDETSASESAEAAEDGRQSASRAPYMSYKSLKNYFARFRAESIPARFDKSYFGNASGSLVAQVRGTLRYFDLIDDASGPTDLLREIVASDEAEQAILLKIVFEAKYADVLALGPNATSGQLADIFRARGLSGATIQKAIAFFLGMAEDVGVEVSPHFKKGRVAATASNGNKRRRPGKSAEGAPALVVTHHAAPASTADQQRSKYVEMLMSLAMNNEGEVQTDLLDRIERALGYDSPPATVDGAAGN